MLSLRHTLHPHEHSSALTLFCPPTPHLEPRRKARHAPWDEMPCNKAGQADHGEPRIFELPLGHLLPSLRRLAEEVEGVVEGLRVGVACIPTMSEARES